MPNRVNIRPGVSVLSVLRHLNYSYWHALAEFVDNAIQSYHGDRELLLKVDGGRRPLRVDIDLSQEDGGRITVRDNAGGIRRSEFQRAFKPAEAPPDTSGLSEFGMGMKSAACWCAHDWSVRTKAIGDASEHTIQFNIDRIVTNGIEELDVSEASAPQDAHYTVVTLWRLHRLPAGRTIGKIRQHLTDIYRTYTRSGELELYFNGERLSYDEPKVLRAPYYRDDGGPEIVWKKEIAFDFGGGLSVHGFAAIRERASTARAGFALFRRGRLIQGSGDEGYRPEQLFGRSNSFTYQRLFGELHLEGFEVSHTKDGFRWEDNEDVFLDLLREHLSDADLPLLQQARGYRVGERSEDLKTGAEAATKKLASVVGPGLALPAPTSDETRRDEHPLPTTLPPARDPFTNLEFLFTQDAWRWKVRVELTGDNPAADWLELASGPSAPSATDHSREVVLRVSLRHPFMTSFAGSDPDAIEPLVRVAAAVAVGTILARESGARPAPSAVLSNINRLLRSDLSKQS